MKKTISVNLANRNFYIEEDAYHVLDQYIKGIREYYRVDDPDGEIVEDFESRLGELFQEKLRLGHEVITLELAKEVIKQLGRIEDLDAPEAEPEGTTASSEDTLGKEPDRETFTEKLGKKLYRDPRKKWLGGVIAGLAVNFNADVSLLRLITVLLLFTPLSWLVVILYLAGWMFLPVAESASDRLKMEGKPLNSENLWQTISKDNPEMTKGERVVVEEKPAKKSNNVLWWSIATLLVLAIICTLIYGIVSLQDGMWTPKFFNWGEDTFDYTGLSVGLALLLAFFAILFVVLILGGLFTLIYVVPIGLILKSKSLGGGAKVVLILLWLMITGFWAFFI